MGAELQEVGTIGNLLSAKDFWQPLMGSLLGTGVGGCVIWVLDKRYLSKKEQRDLKAQEAKERRDLKAQEERDRREELLQSQKEEKDREFQARKDKAEEQRQQRRDAAEFEQRMQQNQIGLWQQKSAFLMQQLPYIRRSLYNGKNEGLYFRAHFQDCFNIFESSRVLFDSKEGRKGIEKITKYYDDHKSKMQEDPSDLEEDALQDRKETTEVYADLIHAAITKELKYLATLIEDPKSGTRTVGIGTD